MADLNFALLANTNAQPTAMYSASTTSRPSKSVLSELQWGCDAQSLVGYKPTTKEIRSAYRYFPKINDAELNFGMVWSAFKSISPMIDLRNGMSANALDIFSLPNSEYQGSGPILVTNLMRAYNVETGKQLSNLVSTKFNAEYDRANTTFRKLKVVEKAFAAQSIVNNLHKQRKQILKQMLTYFMKGLNDVYIYVVPSSNTVDFSIPYYQRTYIPTDQVPSSVFSKFTRSNTSSIFSYSKGQSTARYHLNPLSQAEASVLKSSISKWTSVYKTVSMSPASSSCNSGVGGLPDFLIAGIYPALKKQGNRILPLNSNVAEISTSKAYSTRSNSPEAQNKQYTLGLLNNLYNVVQRYPQEIGTGNLTYRVLNAQLSEVNLGKVCSFLNSRGLQNQVITVKGLESSQRSSNYCNDARVKDFLSALVLIDFMCMKNPQVNNFDVYTRMYIENWLPNRAKALLDRIAVAPTTSSSLRIPSVNLSQIQQIRPTGQTKMPIFRPSVIPQLSPTTSLTPTPTPFFSPISQTPTASEEAVSPLDEQQLLEQQLLEQQLLEQQLLEQQLLEQQLAESQVTSEGETQVTEGDADKKESSKLPYIIGGVVLAGAIGFYVVSRKNK